MIFLQESFISYTCNDTFQESMKMMGLNNWLHWSAWFVKYFLFMLITVGVMTIFLCIDTERGPVIGETSPSVVFVFLMLYAICTISYCFAVSVFFKKGMSIHVCNILLLSITKCEQTYHMPATI